MFSSSPPALRIATSLVGLFLAALLLLLLPAPDSAGKSQPLTPTREQLDVAPVIVKDLGKHHYRKLALDNAMSKRLFDLYLDELDPNRSFFLQSDIDQLSAHRKALDEQLEQGSVEAGFAIYNLYHQRVIERLTKTTETLEKHYHSLRFDGDDSLYIGDDKPDWPATTEAADQRWHARIKHSILNLKMADKPDDEVQALVLKRYKNRLNQALQVRAEDIFEIYINTYAALYDPHTSYFSPRSLENFNIRMSLSLEGIGAVLSQEDEYTKVVRLVKGGPAERQNSLRRDDKIVAVAQDLDSDLINVVGWRLDEVVDLIRGASETWVRLEIISAQSDDPKKTRIIDIQRGKVELEEERASQRVLDIEHQGSNHRVGVIEIPAFYLDFQAYRNGDRNYRSTTRDVHRLLRELDQEGIEGLVIDLRNNGGGSLLEVNQLIWLFIEKGPTVQIRHANSRIEQQKKPRRTAYYDKPMVVLTNRLSASASEIFAGAMQDYQRAVIVGERTFGKGTVQALSPLPHGQLKITQSKYYRISGESTQHRGVIPDIAFPPIYDPEEVGESTLKDALVWDTIAPLKHRFYGDIDTQLIKQLSDRHAQRSGSNPDFVFLTEQLALRQEARARDTITLNHQLRVSERQQLRERRLSIENQRRAAKGEKLLASLEELEAEDKEKQARREEQDDTHSDPLEDDLYLTEAAQVLLDMNQLRTRVAAR